MDFIKFLFNSFAFVVDSIMGIIATFMTILFLMCALGAIVECGPTTASVIDAHIPKPSKSE
jgi:hypothetical protein